MVYKFFEKKLWGGGDKNENISKQELTEELHKPIYRKFQKQKFTLLLWTKFGALI